MRFIAMLKADRNTEAPMLPNEKLLTEMGKLMGEMADAGVLLGGDGLQPSSKGARVRIADGNRSVTDGPFAETKELIAGYFTMQVSSKEEALEWASRCLQIHVELSQISEGEIEVRQIYEAEDFGPAFTPETRGAEQRAWEQAAAR